MARPATPPSAAGGGVLRSGGHPRLPEASLSGGHPAGSASGGSRPFWVAPGAAAPPRFPGWRRWGLPRCLPAGGRHPGAVYRVTYDLMPCLRLSLPAPRNPDLAVLSDVDTVRV